MVGATLLTNEMTGTTIGPTDDAYRRLWYAVIFRAVQDYKSPATEIPLREVARAKRFLLQDWVYEWIDFDITGEEVIRILDNKSWDDIKKLFTIYNPDEEEDEQVVNE